MGAGKRIKFLRLQQFLTQEELAAGLLSVSYLSKIENEQITPSPDILKSLYERLAIEEDSIDETAVIKEIRDWYQDQIDKRKEKVEAGYADLKDKVKLITIPEITHLFNLFSIRYHLVTGKLRLAEELMSSLSPFQKDLNKEQLLYFYKFKGSLLYSKGQFEDAYTLLKEAESLIDSFVSLYEKADIYYSLGLTAGKLHKPYLATYYASLALEIFQKIYRLEKSTECHLLLAISFQRMREFSQAEVHYDWAGKLAQEEKFHSLYGIIEHNRGYFLSLQGHFDKALIHYNNSLHIKESEDNAPGKIITILAVVTMCYKYKKHSLMKEWLNKAQQLIHSLPQSSASLLHEYQIFHYFVHEDYDKFTNYVSKIAIPYFEKNNLQILVITYSEMLGNYFKETRKYKLSSYYFEYANRILNEGIKL
ncbi:helix-turn-helix domain-containing protein [Peribacillus sp. SCS-26]|uniref:helix-turn-helix domain-containing protein n=1 Tax=Paraperibacillus marinus TaxID=3115295 RepID=UPI00390638A4